jgi:hypothetical protein
LVVTSGLPNVEIARRHEDHRRDVIKVNHATSEERGLLIAGMRQLADFLEARDEVPAPRWADVYVFPLSAAEDEMKREIDAIASLIGSDVDDGTAEGLNYTTTRSFGPVQYRAVAISSNRRPSDNDEEA